MAPERPDGGHDPNGLRTGRPVAARGAPQRMSTQHRGSVQSTCSADGRRPGWRRMGTTQALSCEHQMCPRGAEVRGRAGEGCREAMAMACAGRPRGGPASARVRAQRGLAWPWRRGPRLRTTLPRLPGVSGSIQRLSWAPRSSCCGLPASRLRIHRSSSGSLVSSSQTPLILGRSTPRRTSALKACWT